MTSNPTTPGAWANLLSKAWGRDRFPIDVLLIAQDISARQPDPIARIHGGDIGELEGMLLKREQGWYLLYNDQVQSSGRINFTIGHELGHYLLHRRDQESFQCSTQDLLDWGSTARQREAEADKFAATLLMPLDDYRKQVDSARVDIDLLGACATRYGVSLLAAIRQWIEFTPQRAVMVVSNDGFINWSWSSRNALRTRARFRFSQETIPIPEASLAAQATRDPEERTGVELPARVWFKEEPADMSVREMRVVSDQYQLVITLLILPDRDPWEKEDEDEEDVILVDTYTNFIRNGQYPY
jgi:IrrE N-terminal-like domain